MIGLLLLNDVALADALEFPGCISKISTPRGMESMCGGSATARPKSRENLIRKNREVIDIVVQCMCMYWE